MSKNILIFADGTGNEGGLQPDESRTNIYKLFRATRTGPDSCINPKRQIAFYVPGIGTTVDGKSGWIARKRYTAQQMFGIGFTARVSQCYSIAISAWQPGDRIYLLVSAEALTLLDVLLTSWNYSGFRQRKRTRRHR